MYPSDYGYATSGGSTSNRTSCLNSELYNWDSASDCYNNDWLYNSAIGNGQFLRSHTLYVLTLYSMSTTLAVSTTTMRTMLVWFVLQFI